MKYHLKKGELGKDYVCFKVLREDDDTEVTSLTYDQMFKLTVKLNKENEKL